MKRILFILALLLTVAAASAQQPQGERPQDKAEWLQQMRSAKHTFLTRELGLTTQQQSRFFAVYDKMDDELNKVNADTRALERRIADAGEGTVSDLEYDVATEALFNQRAKESEIELRYLPEFREILNKEQLFKLKEAERRFSMNMMRRHHQIRQGEGRRNK